MSPHPLESGASQPVLHSQLRLSAPTCQHEYYERFIEDHRFARAQCLRCPHSWVEVDISEDRQPSGTHDSVRRYPRLISRVVEEDGLEPVPAYQEP